MSYHQKPSNCHGCPAYTVGKSFVKAQGPADAEIALLGQGPGEDEAWIGMPFMGKAGKRLNQWLRQAGLERHRLHVSNVVWCWLPGNRAPRTDEVAFCRQTHWLPALTSLKSLKLVVPIGVPAAQAMLGKKATAQSAGSLAVAELSGLP